MGRFAVTLYEKERGEGVRVYLDTGKLAPWPEFHAWYFKIKPKAEQDSNALFEQIKSAGAEALSLQRVQVKPSYRIKRKLGKTAPCPVCGESYPLRDGDRCLDCQGFSPYEKVL